MRFFELYTSIGLGERKNILWIGEVRNYCKAIDLIIHNRTDGEIYNISDNNEMANIDIVKIICKELGKQCL